MQILSKANQAQGQKQANKKWYDSSGMKYVRFIFTQDKDI